ncbi:MinD/ParA family protein [Microbacterium testaceum]|nr:MinD/ParA family protein [Microbacterium testaceum]
MTPDRTDATPDDGAEHGVLDESGNLDTASITILGGHIAQVSVDLPVTSGDDDIDDDVIEDEIPIESAPGDHALGELSSPTLTADAEPRADDAPAHESELVQEHHVEQLPTGDIILEPHDDAPEPETLDDVLDAEVVDEEPPTDAVARDADEPVAAHAHGAVDEVDDVVLHDASDADGPSEPAHDEDVEVVRTDEPGFDDRVVADEHVAREHAADEHGSEEHDSTEHDAGEHDAEQTEPDEDEARAADLHDLDVVEDVELFEADAAEPVDPSDAAAGTEAVAEPLTHAPWTPAPAARVADESGADEAEAHEPITVESPAATSAVVVEPSGASDEGAASPAIESTAVVAAPHDVAGAAAGSVAPSVPPAPADAAPRTPATGPVPATRGERAATGVIGTIPLTRRSAQQADEAARSADEAARVDRAHAMERVRTPAPEVALTSKRIGQIDDQRESSDLLTADRLLDPRQIARPEPEGLFQQLVYSVSRQRINLGDGRRARERKELDRRISTPLSGGARFVPVLSRKGGVGKTTVTSLLGMALADARDDRIIAVDANPDRGTLADRVGRSNGRTVRDLVRAHDEMAGYNDVSSIVARDATRLDVLASDSDPRVSEAFSDDDYRQVADVAAHYYSIVLTDTGTGIVHSVMGATLELADTLVIVAGLSVDEARLASETLTWLETNGYGSRVRDAVVVLNNSRPGAPLVRENELEAHFRSRVRTVIRMPYDPRIAAGSAIVFRDLQPATRQAARELAAAVVEGLRAPVGAA